MSAPPLGHRIGELRIRLRSPDAAVAENWTRAVEAMTEDRLVPMIGAALDRLASDRLLVLDRIEVDLGALVDDPQALIPALEAALAAAMARLRGGGIEVSDPVALISAYLVHGGLALPGPDAALAAAWAAVADLSPPELARALARLAPLFAAGPAARRLIGSVPPGLLLRMARAVGGVPHQPEAQGITSAGEAPILAALQGLAAGSADLGRAAALVAALTAAPGPSPTLRSVETSALPRSAATRPAPLTAPEPDPLPAETPPQQPAEMPSSLCVPAAGLVILHPFLAPYFDGLGLLAGPGRFADRQARSTGVRLAQRLATGGTNAPEPECVLAKLLCGMDPKDALLPEGTRPDSARVTAEADRLLTAVIGHWSKLGRTSPEGLREAFLRRPGSVQRQGDVWELRVERRGTDVLLDSLPWTIGLLRTPFMTGLLRVVWR